MGNIGSSSLAAGTAVGIQNVPFSASAEVLPRKVLIISTALSSHVQNVITGKPFPVLSPEDVADKTGAGGMAHRLSLAVTRGSSGSVPVYLLIEDDNGAATPATGTITLTNEGPHAAGVLSLYVAAKLYAIPIIVADTVSSIAAKIVAAINADDSAPVTADHVDGVVTVTSKSLGPWGNGITVAINQRLEQNQAVPDGLNIAIAAMTGGAGLPDLADDLPKALGSGDSANKEFFTDVVHGYGDDATILSALSQYVGEGNDFVQLYSRLVSRPFRSLCGSVASGSAGLANLITLANARLQDRCNGLIARPGSLTHPQEIAAEAIGYMAMVNNDAAEAGYTGAVLSGMDPGIVAADQGQDWTTEYTARDLAVKSGISPTIIDGGSVLAQNIVSFYRPASIPVVSNMYRRMRDISITQNVLNAVKVTFSSGKWQNFTVVADVMTVQNARSRAKARDIGMVKDDLLALINAFMARGWLFETSYSIGELKKPDAVQLRAGGTGFDNTIKLIYSGEGNITDTIVYVDCAFSILGI
ncbi:hypothetical protein LQZ19_08710 [Treponema primitia]|uniref:hypothetical protein n=1 Tax=Treponema primitia TaxID=88058 RepID=UPI0039816CAA